MATDPFLWNLWKLFNAIIQAVVLLLQGITPFLWEKSNEAATAVDAIDPPVHLRNRWLQRAKGYLRLRK